MAEYFVGPVMEKIIDACFENFKYQVICQTGMKEELQRLRDIHPQIQDVVDSAYSQEEIKDPALNQWYWQLRDVINEADDALDEIEYWKLEEHVVNKAKGKKRAEMSLRLLDDNDIIESISIRRDLLIDHKLMRLVEVVQELSKISAEVSTFLHLLDRSNQEQQQQQLELHRKPEAGAMPGNELLGRSEEMEFVRRWLRKPYQSENTGTGLYRNISLLFVVGHGGMGKTTLLQHIFQDGVTEEFGVKMWVSVSYNFDSKTVIKNILQSLKKDKTNLETLGALQSRLLSEVKNQKFLLVLDDIWEDDDWKWDNVLAPLQYGSPGSKILITTRLDSVATKFGKMIKKKETLSLKGLKKDEYLQLFNIHAFDGVDNPDDQFRSIAGKMIEKLLGCPLAAEVIGGFLNSYIEKSYWIKVLNIIIEKVTSDHNQLLSVLKLRYIFLPNILQICFSFCYIFPQDHEFYEDDLIRMWIALGLIRSSNMTGETLEDTGRRYFNILVRKSFFHEFRNYKGYRDQVCYKMHDLLHELPQSVSAQECFRIVDGTMFSIPRTTRHLSINVSSSSLKAAFKKMGELKNLRSLSLSISEAADYDENVVFEILKASKNIRLLVINYPILQKIPDTINSLIHLRYLKVQSRQLEIARSIRQLYHLQFIICKSLLLDKLFIKQLMPTENCQLIMDELVIKDPDVLLMEPLRSMSSFCSLSIEQNKEFVSFPIETELWFLQRTSSLFGLKFRMLQSLQCLPSVLERLSSLETLQVFSVPQLELLPNLPASLQTLELYNLHSLQYLPPLSAIFSLEALKLKNIPLLKSLPDLPPFLEELYIENLENLCCLPSYLPTLKRLEIIKVPWLLKLLDLPSSLTKLKLKELKSLQCLPSSLSTLSSLKCLELKNFPLLKSLPDLPSYMTKLKLKELKSFQFLPSYLSTFSSLRCLELKNIPPLKSLPDLPPSLEELYIENLENLCCPPSCLPTLKRLEIIKVPWLLELPDLPASLTTLYIKDCHPQLMERYENFIR